jgi:hypothetical protein
MSITRRDWFLLCLGPLLALAVPSVLLGSSGSYWRFAASFPPGEPMHVEALLHEASPGSIDVVVLGSSVAIGDVDEALLDRFLLTKSLNLGIIGAPVCANAMLARDVVRLRPRLALLVVNHHDLRTNLATHWARTYDPVVAASIFSAGAIFEERSFHLAGTLGWSNLLCRHRDALRNWFLEYRHRPSQRHPRDNPPVRGARLEQAVKDLKVREKVLRFDGSGPNAEGLRYMAAAFRDAGIRFVVCPAPLSTALYQGNYHPGLGRFLLKEERDMGFDRIKGGELGTYGPEDFIDTYHLGRSGQARYTRAIAEAIYPWLVEGREVGS